MNDYLSVSEINLLLALQEDESLSSVQFAAGSQLTAGVKEAFADTQAAPILSYLGAIIPSLLKDKFGVLSDNSFKRKIIGKKANYDVLLDNFLEKLEEFNIPNTSGMKTYLAFTHFPFDPDTWDKLTQVIYTHRSKLRQEFSPDAWKYIKMLFGMMASDELDEEHLQYIKRNALRIPDALLAHYLNSLKTGEDETDVAEVLKAAQKSEAALTVKYFKKEHPDADDMKKLQEKHPERYKEWRKSTQVAKKAAKAVLTSEWGSLSGTIVDVSEARKLLAKFKIPDPIDKGFIGKVGLGSTKSMMFTYYTKWGKELDSVPVRNVVMNPKYNETDNTYYCTHIPAVSEKGKVGKIYTQDHWKQSAKKLHHGAREALNVLEDIRTTFSTDIKPILNGNLENKVAIAALVCRVIDETAGRIGNPKSVREEETYGIHNLLVKHCTATKDKVILSYIGKAKIPQRHEVVDPVSVKAINILIQGRKEEDSIFSTDGQGPLSPTTVGKYLKSVGFPGKAHRFRKIWANKLFNEGFSLIKPGMSEKDALAAFWKAVEPVTQKLGHTERNTSVKSYIDPVLMDKWWKKVGYQPPNVVQKAIDKMSEQDPDGDE